MDKNNNHEAQLLAATDAGYNDALFDGYDTFPDGLECGCEFCRAAYNDGVELAAAEIAYGRL
jgi:hypothetical protein